MAALRDLFNSGQTEAFIAAQNPGGGGAHAISGDTFMSCTAFTVDQVPRAGSIVDAPPRSTDRRTAIDRQSDLRSLLVADALPITLYPTVSDLADSDWLINAAIGRPRAQRTLDRLCDENLAVSITITASSVGVYVHHDRLSRKQIAPIWLKNP